MHDQIAPLQSEFPIRLEVVDISGDPLLEQQFRTEIPVLFINGRKAVKYRISTPALRDKLRRVLGHGYDLPRPLR